MMQGKIKDAVDLFLQGTIAFAKIEHNGIRIDVERLDRTIEKVGWKIRCLQQELRDDDVYSTWRKTFGDKANLGSREQLGIVLFNKMKLPYNGERTKTGRFKVDEEVLHSVDLPFVKKYLQLEHLKKTKATYLEGIRREVVDGILHPFFNLAGGGDGGRGGARSMRSSSSSPNFQNLPIRNPKTGAIVRKCFVPRPGRRLVEVDFGALEFRIAAAIWKDPAMIDYASDPTKDIHRDEAAELFLCETDNVSKEARYLGKNGIVFPILYGSYYVQCAKRIWDTIHKEQTKLKDGTLVLDHLRSKGIDRLGLCKPGVDSEEGTFEYVVWQVERNFFSKFSVLKKAKDDWLRKYRERGFFRMVTGFTIEGLYTNNQLLNLPVQGPGFHCLLWSVIRLQNWLERKGMKSLIVGQIHDCILIDAVIEELQLVLNKIKKIMTADLLKAWKWICVPLSVEVDVTDIDGTWHDKKPWIEKDGIWGPKE